MCVERKTSKLRIISLFLPLRGGHFVTMETVTGALRFFKHFNWKHQEKILFCEALTKNICCALNTLFSYAIRTV